MKIVSIREKSLADMLDLREGDELLSINGHPVSDYIDFLYHASDVDLHLEVRRGSEQLSFDTTCEVPAELGLQFDVKLRLLSRLEESSCKLRIIFDRTGGDHGQVHLDLLDSPRYRHSLMGSRRPLRELPP